MTNSYTFSKDEIKNVRYEKYDSGYECTIEVDGRDFSEKASTKEHAYIKAVLLAEFILLPIMPDGIEW